MNKLYIMDAENALDLIESNTIQTIYIDPPYNTQSKQFEYNDNHHNWSDFMRTKLEKSWRVLKESGVIFISIDDNKLIELRLLCDQIFHSSQFLGMFITRQATRSNAKFINTIHEYVVVYAKNKKFSPKFKINRLAIPYYAEKLLPLMNEIKKTHKNQGQLQANNLLKQKLKEFEKNELFSWLKNYSIVDENGEICFATDLSTPGTPADLAIPEIDLFLPALNSRSWSSKEKFIQLHNENKLLYKQGRPYEKHLLKDSTDNAMSILNFYSRQGKHDLEKLNLGFLFSTAKPVEMIKYFIKISQSNDDNDIILDYFAGSGTTAQAVMECNQEDSKCRQFILVQIKEPIKNNKKAQQYLSELQLPLDISSITKLRLDRLEYKYQYFEQ